MKKPTPFTRRVSRLAKGAVLALAASTLAAPVVSAQERDSFKLAWSIYAGWIPWLYIDESGIMKKWADKYDIEVEIVQINDYIESINQYTAGQFDGVVATSMDALSIPAAGGVDTTALIVGDYSNGNDGLVMKDSTNVADLKGQQVNLVELSVSHYLLARALDSVGLRERDVTVVNTGDADIVAAFNTSGVRNVVTWNPLLDDVASVPGANRVFDSSMIPGHIKDLTIVNTATLAANPALGKALTGAWFELMAVLGTDSEEGQKARAFLGEASGTDQAGYEAQLAGMQMFWQAADALAFIASPEAVEAMDSVREFSFDKGLLGEGAPNADFVGISFPNGVTLGDSANIRLRFDPSYMQMAADGAL
ncbi:putative urea ABC transporter substrate-binding protein [Pseudomonas jilinensis]|uniref:Lipid kinase n=1 Tax=Pseudomonas jilinensis TaxID=2078689 RepID=A0A396RU06_9PSED|nr:putative urea ABC transporter substrate-binding protein [Pseudomonas jilinensis]RHW20050.1 lipid kinase [Pseudomonas jilinensis]